MWPQSFFFAHFYFSFARELTRKKKKKKVPERSLCCYNIIQVSFFFFFFFKPKLQAKQKKKLAHLRSSLRWFVKIRTDDAQFNSLSRKTSSLGGYFVGGESSAVWYPVFGSVLSCDLTWGALVECRSVAFLQVTPAAYFPRTVRYLLNFTKHVRLIAEAGGFVLSFHLLMSDCTFNTQFKGWTWHTAKIAFVAWATN